MQTEKYNFAPQSEETWVPAIVIPCIMGIPVIDSKVPISINQRPYALTSNTDYKSMTTAGQPMWPCPFWAIAAFTKVAAPGPLVTPCAACMWPLTTRRGGWSRASSCTRCFNAGQPDPPSTMPLAGPCATRMSHSGIRSTWQASDLWAGIVAGCQVPITKQELQIFLPDRLLWECASELQNKDKERTEMRVSIAGFHGPKEVGAPYA